MSFCKNRYRPQLKGWVQPGPVGHTGGRRHIPSGGTWSFLIHSCMCLMFDSFRLSSELYTSPAPHKVYWGSSRLAMESHDRWARHSVGVIPLSIHSRARVLCLCHSAFQMLALVACLDVWGGKTVCRKLDLNFSLGGGAVWLSKGCLKLSSCAKVQNGF